MSIFKIVLKCVRFGLELIAAVASIAASDEHCGAETARARKKRYVITQDEYIRATEHD